MLRRTFACLCEAAAVGQAPARHAGQCMCGTVKYAFEGTPDWVAHVHSKFYRQSHGAASVMVAGVVPKRFVLEEGEGYLHRKAFNSIYKHTCKKCGTHVYDDWLHHHKKIVFPTHLECMAGAHRMTADWQAFTPQFHLHYESALLPQYDGLPKYANMPHEWRGGTGELLQEDFPEAQYFRYNGYAGDASWPPHADDESAAGA